MQEKVEKLVRELGTTVLVRDSAGFAARVPRHYIACHGLKEGELRHLARRYGWEIVFDR